MDVCSVLSTWGQSKADRMKNYRTYVEQGLTEDLENPFLSVREQSILGSDSFVDAIKRKYLLARELKDAGEEAALRHFVRSFGVGEIVSATASIYGVEESEMLRRRSKCREGRRLAMYAAAVHCRHAVPLADVARHFNVSLGGLSSARARIEARLESPEGGAVRAHLAAILARLAEPTANS
jgi:hypothetical protein